MNSTELKHLAQLLESPKKIVIVPHRNPDGDALGATLALYLFLKPNGHELSLIAPNDYPEFLKWMPSESDIIKYDQDKKRTKKLIADAELIFTLDFNLLSRVGEMEKPLEEATADFVMIDHHQQPGDYALFTESNAKMSSTCEMIYQFIDNLGHSGEITPEIATCLYTGIMTDTGSFRFASTTSETHRVIAHLMDKGARNSEIHQLVYDTNSYNRLQLLGVALRNLKVEKELNTAYISLSQEELDHHNFKKGDTEGFVNYALSLKGIAFAAIFIESTADNIIKISLRSKGEFNVNEFARAHFNGGGHHNAAGGKSDDDLKTTIQEFVEILPQYKDRLK